MTESALPADAVVLDFSDDEPRERDSSRALVAEVAVPVFHDESVQIVDSGEVLGEPLLDWREAQAWLDINASDWREYRVHPPYLHAFGKRWFDVRELRQWIGRDSDSG